VSLAIEEHCDGTTKLSGPALNEEVYPLAAIEKIAALEAVHDDVSRRRRHRGRDSSDVLLLRTASGGTVAQRWTEAPVGGSRDLGGALHRRRHGHVGTVLGRAAPRYRRQGPRQAKDALVVLLGRTHAQQRDRLAENRQGLQAFNGPVWPEGQCARDRPPLVQRSLRVALGYDQLRPDPLGQTGYRAHPQRAGPTVQ